jgi:hypothetical protein
MPADDQIASDKIIAPNGNWLAAWRRVPDDECIWNHEIDGSKVVVCSLKQDMIEDAVFSYSLGGRTIGKFAWCPNSRFLVYSTSSSGGHSPWHFNTFVWDTKDHTIRSVDSLSHSVIDPKFSFKGEDTLIVFTLKPDAPDFSTHNTVELPLPQSISKMKVTGTAVHVSR